MWPFSTCKLHYFLTLPNLYILNILIDSLDIYRYKIFRFCIKYVWNLCYWKYKTYYPLSLPTWLLKECIAEWVPMMTSISIHIHIYHHPHLSSNIALSSFLSIWSNVTLRPRNKTLIKKLLRANFKFDIHDTKHLTDTTLSLLASFRCLFSSRSCTVCKLHQSTFLNYGISHILMIHISIS